jgi:hypothetical protein
VAVAAAGVAVVAVAVAGVAVVAADAGAIDGGVVVVRF